MGQQQVNVFLGQMIEGHTFGQDAAQERMDVLDSRLLVGRGGIAVEDARDRLPLMQAFQGDGIGELGAVVGEDNGEHTAENICAEGFSEGPEDVNDGLRGIPFADKGKKQVAVGEEQSQQYFPSNFSNDRVHLHNGEMGVFRHKFQIVLIAATDAAGGVNLVRDGLGASRF